MNELLILGRILTRSGEKMGKKVICAGHVCLDITPVIPDLGAKKIEDVLQPGKLLNVGEADISLGGSVSNTGIGMKVLGNDVSLMGKIGCDAFGEIVESLYGKYGVAEGLLRNDSVSTSYSVALAIPGIDRIFLHHPGANDTFTADDIPWERVKDAALFHFGYPPLMKSMYENEGEELVRLFKKAKESGAATSLDLAAVDPGSSSGKADWKKILSKVLPFVDFFVPSVEELCFMLDRDRFLDWKKRAEGKDVCEIINLEEDIRSLADKCMEMGCKVLMIKCGAPGMYLRTAGKERLDSIGSRIEFRTSVWEKQDFFEKSYLPDRILSGTGAGDTSIAAFLTAVLNGENPEWAMHYAAATGASCITELDAISGLKTLPELKKKIESGWAKRE